MRASLITWTAKLEALGGNDSHVAADAGRIESGVTRHDVLIVLDDPARGLELEPFGE
jgi:hypothetical protein